jgi:hypothetical protein
MYYTFKMLLSIFVTLLRADDRIRPTHLARKEFHASAPTGLALSYLWLFSSLSSTWSAAASAGGVLGPMGCHERGHVHPVWQ